MKFEEALALLISNTKRHKRNASITKVADAIALCLENLDGINELADRIGLSKTMIRQFLSVTNLAPEIYSLFAKRELDSVDICSQLASLEAKDQGVLSQYLLKGEINSKELRDVRDLRRKDPSSGINVLVEKVRSARPTKHYVYEFIVRGSVKREEVIEILEHEIGEDRIIDISFNGSIGTLKIDDIGQNKVKELSKGLGVNIQQIIPELIKTRRKDNDC